MDKSAQDKAEKFRRFIETEVLKIIKQLIAEGKTKQDVLQAIARKTLELIKPGMSLDELYSNAVKLDDDFPQLAPVVFKIMKEYEEKYEKKAIEQVSELVRNGQYDQAQEMIKKVLAFKAAN